MSRWRALVALVAGLPALASAQEAGFAEIGRELEGGPTKTLDWSANLRSRAELLHNLDLDRGLDSAGLPLYPVPPSHPQSQTLSHADLRLRTDVALRTPHGGGGIVLRLDWLDNLAMGAHPNDTPSATTGQRTPVNIATLRRAYGLIALPFGALAVGRMSAHWGLGMVAHGGDGIDSNRGDASDRAVLVTPLAGHIWALAYDWSATGPAALRPDGLRTVDLDPSDDVRSLTLAVLNVRTQVARDRRTRADKTTVEYGAYASTRWQNTDAPATWSALTPPAQLQASDWVARGLRVYAADAWARALGPWGRVEAEAVVVRGGYDQASLLPGVAIRERVEVRQWGVAAQSEFGDRHGGWSYGLDGGAASGDAAPGVSQPNNPALGVGKPGAIHGSQLDLPRDKALTELHMHPDFRVDRILFAEIYGGVVDAAYLRPHLRKTWAQFGAGQLFAELAVVQSWMLAQASAPGQQRALGLEIDPTLAYVAMDGISAQLQYGLLLPQSGLDNPAMGMAAHPAQMVRLLLRWAI